MTADPFTSMRCRPLRPLPPPMSMTAPWTATAPVVHREGGRAPQATLPLPSVLICQGPPSLAAETFASAGGRKTTSPTASVETTPWVPKAAAALAVRVLVQRRRPHDDGARLEVGAAGDRAAPDDAVDVVLRGLELGENRGGKISRVPQHVARFGTTIESSRITSEGMGEARVRPPSDAASFVVVGRGGPDGGGSGWFSFGSLDPSGWTGPTMPPAATRRVRGWSVGS